MNCGEVSHSLGEWIKERATLSKDLGHLEGADSLAALAQRGGQSNWDARWAHAVAKQTIVLALGGGEKGRPDLELVIIQASGRAAGARGDRLEIERGRRSICRLTVAQHLLPALQREVLNCILQLPTPSVAFWDETPDGAIPLEQRNAELVQHRDGLAEAEDPDLLLHLVGFLASLHHPAPHLQVKDVEAYGITHAKMSAALAMSLQDCNLKLWCLLANGMALFPALLRLLRPAADLAFFCPPPRQVLASFTSATLAVSTAPRVLAALCVIAANASAEPHETPLEAALAQFPEAELNDVAKQWHSWRGPVSRRPSSTAWTRLFGEEEPSPMAPPNSSPAEDVASRLSKLNTTMAGGRKTPAKAQPAQPATRTRSTAVPRDEALQRLQEAFVVLKQTKQGNGQGLEDCARAVGADDLMRHPSPDREFGSRTYCSASPESRRMQPVLELFLEQLALLKDPMGPNYTEAFGLLERLTEIRGFMLIFDCPDPESVIISLVTTCLEAARAKMGSSDGQLESLLTPLLTNILGEADELPKHALGELLEELMTKRKGAASLVRRVLGGLAEGSAAVPINDYLNKALFTGEEELRETEKAPGYKISQERLEGILCATSELYSIQPSLDRFRDRLGDADDGVRMTALEGAAGVLQSAIAQVATAHPVVAVGESLREKILERCLDPNDAIRLRAVEIVTEAALASEAGVRFLLPILPDACRRILDKKPRVREACAEASAKLYAKHALPRWTEGNYQAGQELNWIPQLLCEAYAAFCSSRLGYVAQLEEHIEQHVLGCGAGLSEGQRALALLGFYSSAAQGTEAAVHGLQTLLAKKRDAHRALRRYIQKRSEKAAPLGEADAGSSLALVPHEVAAAEPHSRPEAIEWLEQLGRLSPTMDDKYTRPEVLAAHIRAFDAVRDKGLWKQLEKLLEPAGQESTAQLAGSLQELDRLLRVHRLAELAPLLRRALVSTWLLPDQVAELLNIWKSSPEVLDEAPSSELVAAAGITIANLAKSFPGAFMPFVGELAKLLPESSAEDAKVILQTLAAIAKRADLEPSQLEAQNLSQTLLEALSLSESSSMASLSRKVAKIMLLLSEKDCCQVSLELLKWAEENKEASESKLQALSLQLAAALLEWSRRHPHFPHLSVEPWLAEARRVLSQPNGERDENTSMVQCAAADLLAAAGSAEDVAKILLAPKAAVATEALALTDGTEDETRPTMARPTSKLSSSASKLKPAERLRVCTALPAVFALASLKRHRDAAQLMLQGSLRAAWQGPQTELLDFAVACFVHFLSRLDVFKKEVAEKVSAFPDSSKVAAFFCDALLRCDVQHSAELLGVALPAALKDPEVAKAGAVVAQGAHAAQALATPQRRPSLLKRATPSGESPGAASSGSGKRSVTGEAVKYRMRRARRDEDRPSSRERERRRGRRPSVDRRGRPHEDRRVVQWSEVPRHRPRGGHRSGELAETSLRPLHGSHYMAACGIKEFYNCKYDPKNPEFWKQIELPNGADEIYVCIGVKASNYFMPAETLSDKGPGGGEEQAYHACLNVMKMENGQKNKLVVTWWPWGAGMFATSLGPHDACFVAAANENKNSGYMVNWWIPAALQKEITGRRREDGEMRLRPRTAREKRYEAALKTAKAKARPKAAIRGPQARSGKLDQEELSKKMDDQTPMHRQDHRPKPKGRAVKAAPQAKRPRMTDVEVRKQPNTANPQHPSLPEEESSSEYSYYSDEDGESSSSEEKAHPAGAVQGRKRWGNQEELSKKVEGQMTVHQQDHLRHAKPKGRAVKAAPKDQLPHGWRLGPRTRHHAARQITDVQAPKQPNTANAQHQSVAEEESSSSECSDIREEDGESSTSSEESDENK
eukprot:g15066.t1